jgi:hypothetical protein
VTTASTEDTEDDDMPAVVDFSQGVRGKFFRIGARVTLPADDDTGKDIEPTDVPE